MGNVVAERDKGVILVRVGLLTVPGVVYHRETDFVVVRDPSNRLTGRGRGG